MPRVSTVVAVVVEAMGRWREVAGGEVAVAGGPEGGREGAACLKVKQVVVLWFLPMGFWRAGRI